MVGLEKIISKIMTDAQTQADGIIADAEARCKDIEISTEQKKRDIESEIEASAVRDGENIKMLAKSSIAKHKRDSALALRADLTDKAFEDAVASLASLEREQYISMLASLMAKVICERVQSEEDSMRLYGEDISSAKYELVMNKKDKDSCGKSIIDSARRVMVGKLSSATLNKIVLSEKTANIEGGFIIKCGDIELNCSLRALVASVRLALESNVAETLFGKDENKN